MVKEKQKPKFIIITILIILILSDFIMDLFWGSHPNKELQKDWKELGEGNFSIEILDTLAYDEDESKTDYTKELELLKMVWEEKLENMELYR